MLLRMRVSAVTADPATDAPVVVLEDETGRHALSVAVGLLEARAIAAGLERIDLLRPMTHCLMARLLAELGAAVTRVEIRCGADHEGHSAAVHVRQGERGVIVDARPSDAIALALRVGAPVWVERALLPGAHVAPADLPVAELDAEVEREFLSAVWEDPSAAG